MATLQHYFYPEIDAQTPNGHQLSSRAHRQPRNIASDELFRKGEDEISITHGESVYRLKVTRQGRLVLNK